MADGNGPVRIVVVGWGPVAARFVEGLLPASRARRVVVTVVGAEPHDAYNRVLIAEYAVGRADRARLEVVDSAAAVEAGIGLRLGCAVVAIDREAHTVRLDTGATLAYDRLVLATGARATVPTLAGLETARRDGRTRIASAETVDHGRGPLPDGVLTLRDLHDAERVLAAVRGRRRIVVLGAGVLGMEAALATAETGASVVVVHHGDFPMARNLDRSGGRTLALAAREAGVEMAAHARAEGVLLHDGGNGVLSFQALLLADGGQIDGELLILSCGVTPRDELAVAAGLAVARGVLVDAGLRSWTDPDVFALGDCAHVAEPSSARSDGSVPGGPSGLIGPGWRQADWLAGLLVAEATADAAGAPPAPLPAVDRPAVVMLKAEGVDVVAGGDITADPWDREPDQGRRAPREVAVWAHPARGSYVKTVTRDGVLEGFVCVGMPRTGAELTLLFERGGELPADRSTLLRLDALDGGAVPTGDPLAADATVCWCNGVTVAAIGEAIAEGADSVETVGACTRAGTGCGTCRGRIAELLARATVVA